MADIPPYHEDHFTFSAAGVPSGAAARPTLTVPPPLLSPRFPHRRLVPARRHAHGHATPQNIMFSPPNAGGGLGNRWPGEDVPQNIAVRDQPQDLGYFDINYDGVNNYPLPHPADLANPLAAEYRDRGINVNNYAGVQVAQDGPAQAQAQAQAIAPPPIPEIDIFDNADQHAAAGFAQAFINERYYQAPVFDEPATEVLRRLANHYLNQLNSHVDMFRMEPGPTGGIRVLITLELAGLP